MIANEETEIAAPIRVGLVGLGRAGVGIHYPAFKEHGDFRIAAIADRDPARMAQIQSETGCLTYSSIEELAASGSCDLVVIATPSHLHYQDALTVLNAGISCVLEKPMAPDFEEAETLVELAREKGLHLFVHHQHLFNDEYNYFKEVLERGILGEFFQLRAFWGGFNRRWDWQTLKKNGGGQLNNTCPHVISVVLPLLGEPVTTVGANLRNVKDAGDAEDHVQLLLQTASGRSADIVVTSACALPVPMWMLLGSSGTLSSAEGITAQQN
jgi:predicted dehydrogenase